MSDKEPSDEETESERTVAELHREFERVGVDMHALGEAFRAIHLELSDLDPDDDTPTFGIDAPSALEKIRTLPSGAGTEVFLLALGFPSQGQ